MKTDLGLSVVIPAYNEEVLLADTLSEIKAFLQENFESFEVIVVDDGSDDATLEIARNTEGVTVFSNGTNKGKGYSVKTGIRNAKMEFVLFLDADHAISIHNLTAFLPHLHDYDWIIGSKYLEKQKEYPPLRRFAGETFALIMRTITGLRFKDTQCGFKLFRTQGIQQILPVTRIDGWCMDVELLFIAQKNKLRILELPVGLSRLNRASKINLWSSGRKMVVDLMKIRWNAMKGKYNVR